MKIELPKELRAEAVRVGATLNIGLSPMQVAKLPENYLAEPAALLGRVLDFYLAAVERAYAQTTEEFYRDWPLALEAARATPAYKAVLTLRTMAHKKQTERAGDGNIQLFRELLLKAIAGQVNLYDPLTPSTSDQNSQ